MTVKELIDLLQDFDDDTEVVIAEYQSHGTDFAYDVWDVSKTRYSNWDDDALDVDGVCVQITIGSQIGTMCDEGDELDE